MSTLKTCCKCKTEKPTDSFHKDKRAADGNARRCKECSKELGLAWRTQNKDRHRANSKSWATKNPIRVAHLARKAELRRKYGITPEQYNALLVSQSKRCAICATDKPGGKGCFHVDHDHKTGKVRGLLCLSCNTLLGTAKDSTWTLSASIRYLERGN